MAAITPLTNEQNLGGELAGDITATDTTITVRHIDIKTGAARTPLSTSLLFTIDKDSSNAENILAGSHSTSGGVTTYINCVRGVSDSAISVSAGTGNTHGEGAVVGHVTTHLISSINSKILDGTNGTGANNLRVGDETNSDIKLLAQNADANKPYIGYDSATSQWVISNDGTTSFVPGTGAGAISGGGGITVTAGVIAMDETDTTKFVSTSSGAGDSGKAAILNASGQFASGFIDSPANSLLTAKGSIIGSSAANTPVGIAAGSDGDSLIVDSNIANGLRYAKTIRLFYGNSWTNSSVGLGTITENNASLRIANGAIVGDYFNINTAIPPKEGSINLVARWSDFSNGDIVEFKGAFKPLNLASDFVFGIMGLVGAQNKDTIIDKAIFKITNSLTVLETSTADGTTEEDQSVSGVDLSKINTYTIRVVVGTKVDFIINGTLKNTHTTNIPLIANSISLGLVAGINNSFGFAGGLMDVVNYFSITTTNIKF